MIINNLLFFIKNIIFNNYQTPKQIRHFDCILCFKHFVYPFTSKDYLVCNKCFKTLK